MFIRVLLPLVLSVSFSAQAQNSKCPWVTLEDVLYTKTSDYEGTLSKLSVAQIQTDLECLKALFRYQYSATPIYKKNGIDLEQKVTDLQQSLTAEMNQESLMDLLLKMHFEAYDLHLTYLFKTDSQYLKKRLPEYKPYHIPTRFLKQRGHYKAVNSPHWKIKSCEGLRPHRAFDETAKEFYIFTGQDNKNPPTHSTCLLLSGKFMDFPLRPIENQKLPEQQFFFKQLPNKVVYVRIPHYFTPTGVPEDRLAFIKFLSENDVPLIIDQRNNTGGDPEFAFLIAQQLMLKDKPLPSAEALIRNSLFAPTGLANLFFESWKQTGDITDQKAYEFWLNQAKELQKTDAPLYAVKDETMLWPQKKGLRDKVYQSPVVILTDKQCASACEALPFIFSGVKNFFILGTHTGGYLRFGTPGLFTLPNSKIIFHGGWFGLNDDVGIQEGIGFAPTHYYLGKDPIAAALKMME